MYILKNKIAIRAFEAQSNIYEMFNETIKVNNLNNIKLYHTAVSDKNDEIIRINLPDYSASLRPGDEARAVVLK